MVILVIGIIIIVIFSIVQGGGYPLIVKQIAEEDKIEIFKIFKKSLKKVHKIIALTIMQSLPIVIITILVAGVAYMYVISSFMPLISGLTTTGSVVLPALKITGMATMSEMMITSTTFLPFILVIIAVFLIAFYFTTRLWLSLPVLMIEDLGVIGSLKKSWGMTKRKFWSISGTMLVMVIIVGIINFIVSLAFNILNLSVISYIIDYLIFTPILAILSTIYYYHVKTEREPL